MGCVNLSENPKQMIKKYKVSVPVKVIHDSLWGQFIFPYRVLNTAGHSPLTHTLTLTLGRQRQVDLLVPGQPSLQARAT